MQPLSLTVVDVDGAIQETADAVRGDTRLDFLAKAPWPEGESSGAAQPSPRSSPVSPPPPPVPGVRPPRSAPGMSASSTTR
jgi:hypothetical protein